MVHLFVVFTDASIIHPTSHSLLVTLLVLVSRNSCRKLFSLDCQVWSTASDHQNTIRLELQRLQRGIRARRLTTKEIAYCGILWKCSTCVQKNLRNCGA